MHINKACDTIHGMDTSVYRILDANFNRAREGCRVIEEYCRFILNSDPFRRRIKSVRHRLCDAMNRFELSSLLSGRDSQSDVGRGRVLKDDLPRRQVQDTLVASFKRLTEALRSLGEYGRLVEPAAADVFENLRFEIYTLEKEVLLFSVGREKYQNVRLYVLISPENAENTAQYSDLIHACIRGGADCIQLRCKGLCDKEFLALAQLTADICRQNRVISIINDRVDIAILSGADGVHLGQDELSVAQARRLAPRPLLIGVSTHNLDELEAAIVEMPDYVGLGTVFASPTKPDNPVAGLDYLRTALNRLAGTAIGHAPIGGIGPDNIDKVIGTGVRTAAVSSAVTRSPDPEGACRILKDKLLFNK